MTDITVNYHAEEEEVAQESVAGVISHEPEVVDVVCAAKGEIVCVKEKKDVLHVLYIL